MKRISIIIFVLCVLTANTPAEEFVNEFAGMENLWGDQKAITNKEFEEAIETLNAKQNKKDEKLQKKKIKKISGGGTTLHKNLEPNLDIQKQDFLPKKEQESGQLLNLPVSIIIDKNTIEPGYYNIYGEKNKNGEIYLSFYQSHKLIGKIKAYQTNNDFDSEELNFVKLFPYDNNYMKIVYGSLDFNAYSYIRLTQ